jgi:AcrR family transcriptional regulator
VAGAGRTSADDVDKRVRVRKAVGVVDARKTILETAARLFSSVGYSNTSLSQVAKEAHVSKALIFWHFESKEQLFHAALQHSLEPYTVASDLDDLDEVDQIRMLIDRYYDFVSEHTFSVKLVLSLLLRDENRPDDIVSRVGELFRVYRSLLSDAIESGRKKGIFRSTVDPAQDAALIMAALNGMLIQGFLQEASPDPHRLVSYLKTTFIERLLPEAEEESG